MKKILFFKICVPLNANTPKGWNFYMLQPSLLIIVMYRELQIEQFLCNGSLTPENYFKASSRGKNG